MNFAVGLAVSASAPWRSWSRGPPVRDPQAPPPPPQLRSAGTPSRRWALTGSAALVAKREFRGAAVACWSGWPRSGCRPEAAPGSRPSSCRRRRRSPSPRKDSISPSSSVALRKTRIACPGLGGAARARSARAAPIAGGLIAPLGPASSGVDRGEADEFGAVAAAVVAPHFVLAGLRGRRSRSPCRGRRRSRFPSPGVSPPIWLPLRSNSPRSGRSGSRRRRCLTISLPKTTLSALCSSIAASPLNLRSRFLRFRLPAVAVPSVRIPCDGAFDEVFE